MNQCMFFGSLNMMAQRKNAGTMNHRRESMNLSDTRGISLVMVVTIIQANIQYMTMAMMPKR